LDPKLDVDVMAEIKATLQVYAEVVKYEAVLSLHVRLSQVTKGIKFCLKRK
jgi:hypothetical protein